MQIDFLQGEINPQNGIQRGELNKIHVVKPSPADPG